MAVIQKAPANTTLRRRSVLSAGLGVALASVSFEAGAGQQDGVFRRAGNLVVYLVTIPAAVVRGHPPEHVGRGMHGSPPPGRYVHHLVVAVFDAATGERVTDATVTAIVHGLHHRPPEDRPQQRISLEPMTVDGALAYGGFTTLFARARFRIEIELRRPGAAPVHAVFQHWHLQP